MSIFSNIGQGNPADSTVDPKQLFRALPKPSGSPFRFPHDIQTEVWDKWFQRRNEPDLVVKMNTGSGKTVVGLLILKSSLNEKKEPAVYLVPNKQLVAQVCRTADNLGIKWTKDPRDPIFRQHQAILITTVHTMYNGKSKFGLHGTLAQSIPVSTVIIDDAHACIPIIEEQFSLTIPAQSPQYRELLALFNEELKKQSMAGHTAIMEGRGTRSVPVPYWDWQAQQDSAYRILSTFAGDEGQNENAQFGWPMLQEHLQLCEAVFSPQQVEVRLPYPDLAVVPSYMKASRRIYMTATLADDSMLTTHMAVASECVTDPIVPSSAGDLGDRIILTPMETSRVITKEQVLASVQVWAQNRNVVVIVPSRHRAQDWESLTTEIHDASTIESVVQKLTRGHLGLVVLIARYDGVDLPGDACRILILDGLPERYSPFEQVEAAALGGTETMNVRQVQRIEQGMGRGVRSTDDYCVAMLLDPRLVERLYDASAKEQLSPATRAQYELSNALAAEGRGKTMSFFDEAIEGFLERDPEWVSASKQSIANVTYGEASVVPPEVRAERDAFTCAMSGQYLEAGRVLQQIYDKVPDNRLKGWLKQRGASYINLVDPEQARKLQYSARTDNNYILKTSGQSSARRQPSNANQAAEAAQYMNKNYSTLQSFEVGIESLLRDLTPSIESGTYRRFEAAFETLGCILGFTSSRPDNESGRGPDNLWTMSTGQHWVVEAKSEAAAETISRDYLGQLSGSADWFDATYAGTSFTQVPILIHPSRTPNWDATPRQGARIMSFERLKELRDAVKNFAVALADKERFRDQTAVGANLRQFHLSADELTQQWTQDFLPQASQH
ncbi:DEAD/DEAH box helicase [Pseudoclavibacter sp. CFCC 13796]|uniref:DEAD/DEAH box helicase n=1 Tax=unclassified Pseudoclavibacter TaxID=2615177 RepID=UPI001300F66D|nr:MULTISPECIES: DEAD/DEAH box helicase [unclassified Pseudoclavibacter]KAB1661558.1 DEAD/DEAH box helicase [Pseudoclavibacter sp. CFCC 13796]MCD7100559.1 DEAD/DEAH box helicase family protein [Pseudoclavibacter sp. 13-3]